MAANKIGVAATMSDATKRVGLIALKSITYTSRLNSSLADVCRSSCGAPHACESYFEICQHVECKKEEQQHTLKGLDRRRGQAETGLRNLTTNNRSVP